MDSYTGLQRTQLHELKPELTNALVVGIIIAKQEPRQFTDGNAIEKSADRAVWNFTLRDSPLNYINVTCWGRTDVLLTFNKTFSIGDVVNVAAPQIEVRTIHGTGEQFRPMVTSPYKLVLSDVACTRIMKHEGNWARYSQLMHFATKPIAGAITIADIHNLKNKIDGVDIFGIVRSLGMVRNVTTRAGVRQVRELIILDQTCSTLKVTVWDPDLIAKAATWKISNTILFITDVRCEWSDFASSMVAVVTSRSVLTEDPVSLETDNLRKYVSKMAPMGFAHSAMYSVQDISSIQNVMNVQQVQDKVTNIQSTENISFDEQQFTALLYVVVTQLDLDGYNRLITTRCSRCNAVLDDQSGVCANTECVESNHTGTVTDFDLRLMLSDHTGSLTSCRLNGPAAAKILNCSVEQFLLMNPDEKSMLKWEFLMERCSVRIHVTAFPFRSPFISILSCELASPVEVCNRLPHY